MNNKNRTLVPALRFPEFKNAGEWEEKKLGEITVKNIDKTKGKRCKLMSITAGQGLISQIEKFGREIAGNSYNNYIVIKKDDFVYNKSSTKIYPEGEIARYNDNEEGAVPNSIFISFRFDTAKVYPLFASFLFEKNIHGYWLRKFISMGARAHGALQVNDEDFFAMPLSFPSIPEQQRIASCLSSLDELIAANSKKLELLKAHKKGLLQNLFPQNGEKIPKYRFPEFKNAGEWEEKKLGEIYEFQSTNSLSRENLNYNTGILRNIHYGDIHTKFKTLFDITKEDVPFINQNVPITKIKKESYCKVGDIIFADASETIDDVGKSIEITNLNNENLLSGLHTLLARQRERKLAIGFGGYLFKSHSIRKQIKKEAQGAKVLGISSTRMLSIYISFPSIPEQQRIASCLSSLDDLISAQNKRIEQLQLHKKGLMQGLFPKNEGAVNV